MRILVVTDRCRKKSATDYLVNALQKMYAAEVLWTKDDSEQLRFIDRVANKLNYEFDKSAINDRLLGNLSASHYDAVIILKGNRVSPFTLRKIKAQYPSTILISWSGDNMCKWHNKSMRYHLGINFYDLVFSVNIPSYRGIERFCTKPVYYFDKRADRHFHYPRNIERENFDCDVLFVGSYEKERLSTLNYLAENGIKIDVFGAMWKRCKEAIHSNIKVYYKELIGDSYPVAISNAKITLGFLRKINEDTQTSRTFEIPACGGFMLMERTQDHLRLFKEGREVEYFDSDNELLEKVHYYLDNPSEREKIARAGFQRVVDDGYYFEDLAGEMMAIVDSEIK